MAVNIGWVILSSIRCQSTSSTLRLVYIDFFLYLFVAKGTFQSGTVKYFNFCTEETDFIEYFQEVITANMIVTKIPPLNSKRLYDSISFFSNWCALQTKTIRNRKCNGAIVYFLFN